LVDRDRLAVLRWQPESNVSQFVQHSKALPLRRMPTVHDDDVSITEAEGLAGF
jgi:hypothetical protein